MEIAIIALMIPITAITLGIGGDIVKRIIKSQERRLEMRLQAQQGQNKDVTHQIDALRAEVARLRDTSTQFDMSLEHSVERLEERIGRVETKVAAPVASSQAEAVQRVGLR